MIQVINNDCTDSFIKCVIDTTFHRFAGFIFCLFHTLDRDICSISINIACSCLAKDSRRSNAKKHYFRIILTTYETETRKESLHRRDVIQWVWFLLGYMSNQNLDVFRFITDIKNNTFRMLKYTVRDHSHPVVARQKSNRSIDRVNTRKSPVYMKHNLLLATPLLTSTLVHSSSQFVSSLSRT